MLWNPYVVNHESTVKKEQVSTSRCNRAYTNARNKIRLASTGMKTLQGRRDETRVVILHKTPPSLEHVSLELLLRLDITRRITCV